MSKRETERRRQQRTLATMSVPEAARQLGIGKNLGYALAARGEIPTIALGPRLKRVPVDRFYKMINGGEK